jgi:hypothetical protein
MTRSTVGARRDRSGRWLAAVLVAPALALVLGACGDDDDGAGGDAAGADEPGATDEAASDAHAAVVLAAGDLVTALQDERTAVRFALAGELDAPGAVDYREASDAADDAITDFGRALDAAGYLSDDDAKIAKEQLSIDRSLVKNDVVIAWPGEGGSYDDGGVLVGRWGPLIDPILDVQERFALLVTAPGEAELAQLYTRVMRQSEDVELVIGAALGTSWDRGTPEWVESVELVYPQATDGREGVLRAARAAEDALPPDEAQTLAEVTEAMEKSLDEQGFGGPVVVEPESRTPDPFVESLALGVWHSYADLVRQRLVDA